MANGGMGRESCGLWQEIKVILVIKGGKGREISPFLRSSLAIRAEKCIVRVVVFFYSFFITDEKSQIFMVWCAFGAGRNALCWVRESSRREDFDQYQGCDQARSFPISRGMIRRGLGK